MGRRKRTAKNIREESRKARRREEQEEEKRQAAAKIKLDQIKRPERIQAIIRSLSAEQKNSVFNILNHGFSMQAINARLLLKEIQAIAESGLAEQLNEVLSITNHREQLEIIRTIAQVIKNQEKLKNIYESFIQPELSSDKGMLAGG